MVGSVFVASEGLFCNEVNRVVVAGTGSSGSANGVGTSAAFDVPYGMATSPDGSFVLIADQMNHKIRKLMVSTGAVSTLAGSGIAGGGNGIGTSAQLSYPADVSISSDGLFAVSSCHFGHRLRRIELSTRLVTTIGGDGSSGHSNGVGTNSRFDVPYGVHLFFSDSQALVIANGRVRKIDMSSLQVTTVAGSGSEGSANGIGTFATFIAPRDVVITSSEEFALVSENGGHRIRKVVLSTWAVSTLVGSPTSASGSSDGVGTLATFYYMMGLLLTSDDMYVYVAEDGGHKIRRVEISSRQVVTLVSQSGSAPQSHPKGLTWLTQDSVLLISSGSANRLVKVYGTCTSSPTLTPTHIPTFRPSIYTAPHGLFCNEVNQVVVAGTGSSGSANGVGTSAAFDVPYGMATSPDGSFVLIADQMNHKIRKLMVSTGAVSTLAGSGIAGGGNGIGTSAQLSYPADVSISSDGLFAVSSCHFGHRLRRIELSTRLVTTIGGDGSSGHSNGVGTNSIFNLPVGISLYSGDSLAIVVDRNNQRLRLIDTSSLQVTTVAGSGSEGGANGIGTSATFAHPRIIAVSSSDEFAVVSETTGQRLRKVVLSTWAVSTLAGSSSGASGSSDGVGTLTTFNYPNGLLLTSDDMYVYVADRNNHKIRRVETSSQHVVTIVSQADSAALNQPSGVTWSTQNSVLLISNEGSHRLLQMYGTCDAPTQSPTVSPTTPTLIPSANPSEKPTMQPSSRPTSEPSGEPSGLPSDHPSSDPTMIPSIHPLTALRSYAIVNPINLTCIVGDYFMKGKPEYYLMDFSVYLFLILFFANVVLA